MYQEVSLKEQIGKRIRYYRESNGMSLKDLSEKTGIRPEYLRKIENGTASRITLVKIEKIINVFGLDLCCFCKNL